VSDGFSVELLLIFEMPIETTSRQTGVLHDLIDGDLSEPLPVEQPSSALDDLPTRLEFVLRSIAHIRVPPC
jgi:hypothetical protein